MKIPAIPEPERYVGLYVYDFGTHVAVGYTAAELGVLRDSASHRHGTAYQIYRVSEGGALELRGVLDDRLVSREAMCFLRADANAARRDYESLCVVAAACPLPCVVEMQLATLPQFDPPHVTALSYAACATDALSAWLTRHGGGLGDQVVAGVDVHATLSASESERILSCRLPALLDYQDRQPQDVLRSIHQPLQR